MNVADEMQQPDEIEGFDVVGRRRGECSPERLYLGQRVRRLRIAPGAPAENGKSTKCQ